MAMVVMTMLLHQNILKLIFFLPLGCYCRNQEESFEFQRLRYAQPKGHERGIQPRANTRLDPRRDQAGLRSPTEHQHGRVTFPAPRLLDWGHWTDLSEVELPSPGSAGLKLEMQLNEVKAH